MSAHPHCSPPVFALLVEAGARNERQSELDTIGKTRRELHKLVHDELRKEPGCETVTVQDIMRIDDPGDGRNWSINNVFHGAAFHNDIKHGTIAVSYRLSRKFHLLTED
ncbi:hypothetical protein [Tardiphaga sp. P5_C10]